MFSFETVETKTTKITIQLNGVNISSQIKNKVFFTLPLNVNEKGKKKGSHPIGWQNLNKQIYLQFFSVHVEPYHRDVLQIIHQDAIPVHEKEQLLGF